MTDQEALAILEEFSLHKPVRLQLAVKHTIARLAKLGTYESGYSTWVDHIGFPMFDGDPVSIDPDEAPKEPLGDE